MAVVPAVLLWGPAPPSRVVAGVLPALLATSGHVWRWWIGSVVVGARAECLVCVGRMISLRIFAVL